MKLSSLLCWITALCFAGSIHAQYNEKYRPQFHFSASKGWVGDPDGLVKYKGLYHLFWWGHAVSRDLVHWQELPYPMKGGDGSFHYFSGSVVVDKKNTAGFGDSSMVAIYTRHTTDDIPEGQALSYSIDNGQTFQYYDKNPVLDIGSNSFRDPQVFWYKPSNKWMMIVTMPHKHQVSFYESHDLKQWTHLSDFGPMGASESDWEVPDFFQLPVDGNNDIKKWVLTIGQGPNRMQYFLGDFDGKKFTPDSQTVAFNRPQSQPLWIDYGSDYYAARTWRNEDDSSDNRTIMLAWLGNWSYARDIPSKWGKGFESVPREVSLKTYPEGIRMVQTPISELQMLRGEEETIKSIATNTIQTINFQPAKNTYELDVILDVDKAKDAGLHLLQGEGRQLTIGYNKINRALYIDRTHCTDFTSDSSFNKNFQVVMSAPLTLQDGKLALHILVDASSVEVFANSGKVSISTVTFPSELQTGISLFSKGGTAKLLTSKAWMLQSIWTK
ncbi:MAG: glycoside hydrolase family 32 protein [Ferruginibacter sp.]